MREIVVLVVEDERPISRTICRSIQNANPKFVVRYVAYNGSEAKKILDSEKVDIAFLDINIPIYDGLWLLEYMNKRGLSTRAVMLTGYQEFAYAQAALKNQAFDYLLKPLNMDSLTEVLNRLESEVERTLLQEQLGITEQLPRKLFQSKDEFGDVCFIACIFLGGTALAPLTAGSLLQLERADEYINIFLQRTVGESKYWLCKGHAETERILFIHKDDLDYCRHLKVLVSEKPADLLPVTLAVSKEKVSINKIAPVYKKLKQIAAHNMRYAVDSFLSSNKNITVQTDEKLEFSLSKITGNTTLEGLLSIYGEIVNNCNTREMLLEATKKFIIKAVEKLPAHIDYISIEKELYTILENTWDYDVLQRSMQALLKECFYLHREPRENKAEIADEIRHYLEKNYKYTFSNKVLEKIFGYSSFYLRSIFRDIYGKSPNDYLLTVRMEKAKQLLNQKIAVKDVAEATGYSDALYFSKVFKKHFGYNPSEHPQ